MNLTKSVMLELRQGVNERWRLSVPKEMPQVVQVRHYTGASILVPLRELSDLVAALCEFERLLGPTPLEKSPPPEACDQTGPSNRITAVCTRCGGWHDGDQCSDGMSRFSDRPWSPAMAGISTHAGGAA